MRVLVATPFSPLEPHDHAASDLAAPLMQALGELVELHVVAPSWSQSDSPGASGVRQERGYHTHHVAVRPMKPLRVLLDSYPVPLRQAWPRLATAEVSRLLATMKFDILHGEYLPTAEALLGQRVRTSITIHDYLQHQPDSWGSASSSRLRTAFWQRQHRRTALTERRVIAGVDCVFTLSSIDAKAAAQEAKRTVATQPGLIAPDVRWAPSALSRTEPTMLFAGALWRKVNEDCVFFLATEVLPRVRSHIENAKLRVVGANPGTRLFGLAAETEGMELVGGVPSLEAEYAKAHVVLSPSTVPAGILMKAIVPLQIGAPVILNSNSARSIDGLVPGRHACVADSTDAWVSSAVRLLTDGAFAQRMGEAARTLLAEQFSPSIQAATFVSTWNQLPEPTDRLHQATFK